MSKFDGKRRTTFLNGVPSFVPVSASTTEPYFTSCGGKSDRRSDDSQATARAVWGVANQGLFSILLFSTGGSAFFVVRRFEGSTLEDGAGQGQQAWAALREKVQREFVRSNSRGAFKNEQHANALRPGPGRVSLHHG